MSVKEIHRYKEFNDFTGKSQKGKKHSVSYKETATNSVAGVVKTLKVATLVSIVGLGAATAAVQMESPIIDFSGMKTYMEEQPKWQSEGPSFSVLFGDHVHDWDEGQILVDATCTEDGTIEFHCRGCEETKTETVAAKGHSIVYGETIGATCTEDGLSASESCSVCGTVFKEAEAITATGHVPKEVEACEATCTENGYTVGSVCEVCGEGLEGTKVVKAKGHKFGKSKTIKKATCTEDGESQRTCSRCGEVESTVIEAGHVVETISAKAATCKEEGRTEGSKCSRCGEVFVESQAIPKTDHVRQTVSGHDATCTATGLTSGVKCSTCGTVLEAQQKIAALGHNPSTTYVTIGGDNNYPVCLRCGANLCPHAIDGESAIWEDGDSWDASCVEDGHVAGTSCAICGTVFSQGYDIPATGQHKLSNEYAVVERATCTSKGKTVYLCEICEGEIEVETPIDSSEHSFTIQIMDEEGNITDVRCDRCGASMGAAIETPSVD